MTKVTFDEATKLTRTMESAYEQTLKNAYQTALNDIDKKIRREFLKHGVDGKFSYEAMMKMTTQDRKRVTRLQALEKNVLDDLNALNRGRPQELSSYLTDVYVTNYTVAGAEVAKAAKVKMSFDIIDRQGVYKSVLRPMAKIGLEDNADIVRRAIKRDITTSIVQGESIQSMSKRIRESLETNANNAVRIARTETTGIMGNARADMLKDAESRGIKTMKVWLSTYDSRTRDRHLAMMEERAENDKPFSNGLMYPADQSGSAAEVVNCRCALIAEVVDEEVKAGTAQAEITNRAEAEQALTNGFRKTNLSKIDDDTVVELARGSDRFGKEFPKLNGYVPEIKSINTKKVIGQYNPAKGSLEISHGMSRNEMTIKLNESMENGWSFKTDKPYEGLMIHERAHSIERYLAEKIYTDKTQLTNVWNSHAVAKDITNTALKNLNVRPIGRQAFDEIKGLGEYAFTDKAELFAQAISDAMVGTNPTRFSVEVLKETKRRLGE